VQLPEDNAVPALSRRERTSRTRNRSEPSRASRPRVDSDLPYYLLCALRCEKGERERDRKQRT